MPAKLAGAAGLLTVALICSPGVQADAAANADASTDLLAAVTDGLRANPAYEAVLAEYRAAQQLVPLAESGYYPQFSLFAHYDYLDESVEGDYYGIHNIDRDNGFTRLAYGANLRQAVYSGDLFLNVDQAKNKVTSARLGADLAEDALIVSVSQAYFGLLAAKDRLSLAEARLKAIDTQLEQVSGRAAAGLALDAELKAAQASRELAYADLLQSTTAVEIGFANLEALTGRRYSRLQALPGNATLMAPDPQDEQTWARRAESNNPGVLVRRSEVLVAGLEAEKARRQRWPRLDITGTVYSLDNNGGISGDRTEFDQRIGVAATVPLFTGGRISADIAGALEGEKKAQAKLAEAKARAVLDARMAYLNATVGQRKMAALKQAVTAAIASEDANRAGYESGTRTNADVLAAVEARYTAASNLATARYGFLTDTLKLKQAAGGLLTADLAQINRLLHMDQYLPPSGPAQP